MNGKPTETPAETAEVTDERIYADLKAYSDAGMIEYVLPTDPLGEQWIVGWRGQILKFTSKEGIVGFLTGIQVAVFYAAAVPELEDPPKRVAAIVERCARLAEQVNATYTDGRPPGVPVGDGRYTHKFADLLREVKGP